MKHYCLPLLVIICALLYVNVNAQVPDSSFAVNAYLPVSGPLSNQLGNAGIGNRTVVQPDGKILVAINRNNPNVTDLYYYTYRFMPDGSPDTTFGVKGVSSIFAGDQSNSKDLFVMPDGKIMVAGSTKYCVNGVCGASQFIMIKMMPDGSADSTFGDAGKIITTDVFAGAGTFAQPERIILQPDGKILMAGRGIGGKPFIGRMDADGVMDTQFATNGIFTDTVGGNLVDLVLSDGNIYALILYYNEGDTVNMSDNHLIKLKADGSLDPTFGNNGRVTASVNNRDNPYSLDILSDKRIAVAGFHQTYYNPFDNGYGERNIGYVLLLNANGSPVTSIPQGFRSIKVPGDSATFIHRVKALDDDRLLLAGKVITKSITGNYHEKAFLAMTDKQANIDTSFNHTGYMVLDYGVHSQIGSQNCLLDLDILEDGSVLATGNRNATTSTIQGLFMIKIKDLPAAAIPSSVSEVETEPQSAFYPNPWLNEGTFSFELTEKENASLYLLDITGRRVHAFMENTELNAGTYTQQLTFPELLPAGVYFLQLSGSNKTLYTHKVVH